MSDERPSDQAERSGTDENLNPFEIAMQQFVIVVGRVAGATSVRGIFP